MKKLRMLGLLPLFVVPVLAGMQSSVSQDGITWTFDKSYECGQFVNGEWWVVGPVTLSSITPGASTDDGNDINGSMINPTEQNDHGLDARGRAGNGYVDSLNIAKQLPMVLESGTSVLSAISRVPYDKPALTEAAVLTVLAQAPAAGTFRPPYYGTDKPLYNKCQLNYDVFHDLTAVPSAPADLSALTNGSCKHVLIALQGTGGAQKDTELKTQDAPSYGREISHAHGNAALALNLDFTDAEKEPLLIELVQRGLDVYGGARAGFSWNADGGHRMGYKLPLYIAAKALGDQEIMQYVNTDKYKSEGGGSDDIADYDRFQEGQQHFYVDQATIDAGTGYGQGDLGLAEWIHQAFTSIRLNPNRSSKPSWGDGYRQMNGSRNTTNVLVLNLMGGRNDWNHEAMFEYIIDRFWPAYLRGENATGTNGIKLFTAQMWNMYFDKVEPPVSAILEPVRPSNTTGIGMGPAQLWSIDGRLQSFGQELVPGIYIQTGTEGSIRPIYLAP